MSSFILSSASFRHLNGFYKKAECREVVYRLYNRKCQGCRVDLSARDDYVSGHIIAARHAKLFEQLFPDLDVDNLLNLHLLCHPCNVRQSAYHFDSPFFLNQVFKESARAIELRYARIQDELSSTPADPRAQADMAVLARAESECLELLQSVKSQKSPIFSLSPEIWSRVHRLVDLVLRDRSGRFCTAGGARGEAWAADLEGEAVVTELLAAPPSHGPHADEKKLRAWLESNGPGSHAALKAPLLTVLRATRAGIRAHRNELRGGAPVTWEDTPKSLTTARLAGIRQALLENEGAQRIAGYLSSFAIVPYEALAPHNCDGWLGWPESESDDILNALGAAAGGLTPKQSFWLLADAASASHASAALKNNGSGCHLTGALCFEGHDRLMPPVQKGLWLSARDLQAAGGLRMSQLDATDQARLQVVLRILQFTHAGVDESGDAWAFHDSALSSLILRANTNSKEPKLRHPVARHQKGAFDGAVSLTELELLVKQLPRLLSVMTPEDAWSTYIWGQIPEAAQALARYSMAEQELPRVHWFQESVSPR